MRSPELPILLSLTACLSLFACDGPRPPEPAVPAPAPAAEPAPPPAEPTFEGGEWIGEVGQQPESIELDGPLGKFRIDTFEASLVDGVARSVAGVSPARGTTWEDADAACRKAGKRLCTEAEWLTACTGQLPVDRDRDGTYSDDPQPGLAHPYGANPDPSNCASARDRNDPRPLITGNHPRCVGASGVLDLEGGVKEWVGIAPYEAALQGGSYFSKNSARCAYHKANESPDVRDQASGFRCCTGPAPEVDQRFAGGRVGEPIQSWSAPTFGGGSTGSDALAGKPYVLAFWATWCGPCRKELPVLAQLYEQHKDEGFTVIAVSIDKQPAAVGPYLKKSPLPFPVALDPKGELMAKFDAPTTPTSFFVTRSGEIRQRNVGYDARSGIRELQKHVTGLIAAE